MKTIIMQLIIFCCVTGNLYADTSIGKPTSDNGQVSAIDRRIQLERESRDNPFVLMPHRPTYLLPLSYSDDPNNGPFEEVGGSLQRTEIKGQISVKFQLARDVLGDNSFIYIAYTQKAHWQAYNSKQSSAFRDTNHEPELFLTFLTNKTILGMKNRVFNIGINHQSNGQKGSFSRSWNRIFAEFILERNNFYMSLKPWWRIPEDEKKNPNDAEGDDNPEITHYMGYGEITGLYENNDHNFGFVLRNNLKSENRGALQLDWTFPLTLTGHVRGYVQYFNGYGETLLDYNYNSNRLSIGFMMIDWL